MPFNAVAANVFGILGATGNPLLLPVRLTMSRHCLLDGTAPPATLEVVSHQVYRWPLSLSPVSTHSLTRTDILKRSRSFPSSSSPASVSCMPSSHI
jgi:hypothetical protein